MFSRLRNLIVRQYFWVLEAYFRLAWIKLVLKFGSPKSLLKKIQFGDFPTSRNDSSSAGDTKLEEMRIRSNQMHESIRLAARLHFGRTDCLPRALVLASMLGKGSCVKIGVQKNAAGHNDEQPRLASHAWVEYLGDAVSEPQDLEKFVPLQPSNRTKP